MQLDREAASPGLLTVAVFRVQVHRVHGFYGSEDSEQGNIDGVCAMLSTLFSHDSEVEGTITERGRVYNIKREARFRSYAAGSWGCNMPKAGEGKDPINYPWSWCWLVVPNENPQLVRSAPPTAAKVVRSETCMTRCRSLLLVPLVRRMSAWCSAPAGSTLDSRWAM